MANYKKPEGQINVSRHIRINNDLYNLMKKWSRSEDRSISDLVRSAVMDKLKNYFVLNDEKIS